MRIHPWRIVMTGKIVIPKSAEQEDEGEGEGEGESILTADKLWWYPARVLNVVDGDTLDLMVDLGFQSYTKIRVRLYGIDTPEVYGVKKDSDEYAAGVKASEFARTWVVQQEGLVHIRTHDGKVIGSKAQGKYGRWIVEVFPADEGKQSLNEALVVRGLAERKDYD